MIVVSIIIVNFNTFELTCKCIQSIYDNVDDLQFEIILVDNASKEIDAKKFTEKFPSILLIENDENVGFAKGNNTGILYARGEYILLLNSDTELIPGNQCISICTEFLAKNVNAGVVSARLEYPDGKFQSNCQRFPGIKYKLYELLRVQKLYSSDRRGKLMLGAFFKHNQLVECDWVWGTFYMFRKQMLLQLPGNKLNEDYFMYGEDIQWSMDFKKLEWKIYFDPRARIIHHMGGSKGNKNELIEKSYQLFLSKNYNGFQRFLIRLLDGLLR